MQRRGFLKDVGIASALMLVPNNLFGLENIVGNVEDVLSNKPVEGAKVKLYNYPSEESIGEFTTDSEGRYNSTVTDIEGYKWRDVKLLFNDLTGREKSAKKSSSNIVKAEIAHPDYLDAVRYFDLNERNLDTGIINKNFDMEVFDSWTRTSRKSLQRWENEPQEWIVNTRYAKTEQVDLVKEIISTDIAEAMGWNPLIREIDSGDNIGVKGSYLVYCDNIGIADSVGNHNETLDGNTITSASAWFYASNAARRIFLKSITQGLGLVRNTAPSNADFWTTDGYYTQQGKDMLKVLYSMKPGNISPDTDAAPL